MKTKWLLVLILCMCTLLLCICCDKICNKKRPKDVKPINWENYNDVHTVYWNYYLPCKEIGNKEGNVIMVEGWICKYVGNPPEPSSFVLLPYYTEDGGYGLDHVYINCSDTAVASQIQSVFDATDFRKKCFIKGRLFFKSIRSGFCCSLQLHVHIDSIENIRFEKEKE